jgi:hypothetical protein
MVRSFRLSRVTYASLVALVLAIPVVLAASCASGGNHGSNFDSGSGGSSPSGDGPTGPYDAEQSGDIHLSPFPTSDSGADGSSCDGGACSDFPTAALIDTTAGSAPPANVATLFTGDGATDTTTGAPCLSEPATGALYPYNWLQPRVYWAPGSAEQTVFEVRIHSPAEANDYVIYTTNNYWVMDYATWAAIAGGTEETAGVPNGIPGKPGHLVGQQLSFVVRGTTATGGTPAISATATIEIAPALAAGSLIFWATESFATNATSTNLQGFRVGDNGTTTVLTPAQVKQTVLAPPPLPDGGTGDLQNPPKPEPVTCIGCHTATPDGMYVGFSAQWPWPNAIASVQPATTGAVPTWLTQGAIDNLSPNESSSYLGGQNTSATNNIDNLMLGTQTFSAAHYKTGDRIEITQLGDSLDQPDNGGTPQVLEPVQLACQGGGSNYPNPCPAKIVTSQLAWINLEWAATGDAGGGGRPSAAPGAPNNGGWGILARTGDSNSAGTPNWSNDGTTVLYTSAPEGTIDGRLQGPVAAGWIPEGVANLTTTQPALTPPGSADISWIPYAAGAGGTATALAGANTTSLNEYFPAFSPDDKLVAFNAAPATVSMYEQPNAEVWVVPFNGGTGGTAVRLAANEPVACTGLVSPGVQNTWPKWAPNPIPASDGGADGGVPTPQVINGFTYYWITFSSTRSATSQATGASNGKTQLYVAGIVVDGKGNINTYAPIYLWNQNDTYNNLIPSWGEFQLPPPTMPPPPPPKPPPPN